MSKNIVICGAGYGGIAAALEFQKHRIPFTLINKHDYHYFKTLLHEVAGGRNEPETYAIAIEELLHEPSSHFIKDNITRVDAALNIIHGEHHTYPFDQLIIAIGSQTAYYGVPGLAEHSLVVNTLATARDIRTHLENTFLRYLETRRKELLRVVIGGAGLTGVELVGELADFAPRFLKKHAIPLDDYELMLVHSHQEILPGVEASLREVAAKKLAERGVKLRLGERIIGATAGEVHLSNQTSIQADTFIWTGGVEVHSILRESGLPVDDRGRVYVTPHLHVQDMPEIYVIGDAATGVDGVGTPLSPTGQMAEQMGTYVASCLSSVDSEQSAPFEFHNHGMVASLGPSYGVAELGKHHATGRTALILKDGSKMKYLMHLGGPHVLFEKRRQWIEI